jgi:OOP family OmpA-OmpF porin
MKKHLLFLSFFVFATYSATAQVVSDTTVVEEEKVMDSSLDSYNKWTIEVNVGQSKGIKPYAPGYFYSNPNAHIKLDVNHFAIAGRYMMGPKFGLKLSFAYDNLQNQDDSGSLPFEMQQFQVGLEGVVNAVRLFSFEEKAGRFGLLFHGGFQAAQMSPQIGINEGKKEYNVGVMFGFTPQLRLTKTIGVHADFTVNSNVRQHFNWDGSYSEASNNLAGSFYSVSLGLSYSFGSRSIHGDWAIIPDQSSEELKALDERIGELETMMNDTDKDGVPDYLDAENNSIAGVAVDTKGRMVDLNKNGVADELEKYVDNQVTTAAEKSNNAEVVKRLINEGYVSVFFDFNSTKPTPASTQNISFVLTYLKNNPNATADITGYADEIGSTEYNNTLSGKRADTVRNTLIKAGIDPSRLNIVPAGEDTSVDKDSDSARRLVRRVIFTIK